MSFNVRVDSITNRNNNGPVEVPSGLTVDVAGLGGELAVNGELHVTGVATVGFLTTQHATVGIITAETLRGDGSGLTNLPNVTTSKAIALKLIFADPPLRS